MLLQGLLSLSGLRRLHSSMMLTKFNSISHVMVASMDIPIPVVSCSQLWCLPMSHCRLSCMPSMIRLSPITPFMLPSSHTHVFTWCTTLISLPKSSQQNFNECSVVCIISAIIWMCPSYLWWCWIIIIKCYVVVVIISPKFPQSGDPSGLLISNFTAVQWS